jgi:hypothetical protein
MSDEAYGDHPDQLFEDLRTGKIVGKQKNVITARAPEDASKFEINECKTCS